MAWRDEISSGWRKLRGMLAGPWHGGRSLVEMRRAIVDDAVQLVTYVGAGKRVFPHHHVLVELLPLDDREHAELCAAVEEGWGDQLRGALLERLDDSGCAHQGPGVEVEVLDPEPAGDDPEEAARAPYRLHFSRGESDGDGTETVRAPARPMLVLEVVRGEAEQGRYELRSDRILVGRLGEVLDEHGRVKRRNHVAFLDEGEENQTVSREQAHIVYREDPDGYWLIDERSAYGTRIFRDGRPIDVSSRDRRGIRLKSGDEVYFGQASVICTVREDD